ncbi:hypothetical protein BDW72DRAFT_186420 [Aspergillus terricola var. indicus]
MVRQLGSQRAALGAKDLRVRATPVKAEDPRQMEGSVHDVALWWWRGCSRGHGRE